MVFAPTSIRSCTSQQKTEDDDINEEHPTEEGDLPPIIPSEVKEAINQMKENKAPGIDDITSDIIKLGGEEMETQLVILFNRILESKKVPSSWKEAKTIIL